MADVVFRGTREELAEKTKQLVDAITGNGPDVNGIGVGLATAVGFAALSDIHESYVTKARGGTDAMGVKWPPLAPSTIARRRVGKKDEASNPDIKERMNIVRREERAKFTKLTAAGMDPREARTAARRYAQQVATRRTGKKKVEVLGGRDVEILRDTGRLLNSLTPGYFNGSTYSPPTTDGGENQVFEATPGLAVVGSRDIRFATHNWGRGHIPQRKILPESPSDIPDEWWDNWTSVAARYLEMAAAEFMANG